MMFIICGTLILSSKFLRDDIFVFFLELSPVVSKFSNNVWKPKMVKEMPSRNFIQNVRSSDILDKIAGWHLLNHYTATSQQQYV